MRAIVYDALPLACGGARQAGEGAFVYFFFLADGNVVTAVAGRTVETVTAHGQLSFLSGFTFSRTYAALIKLWSRETRLERILDCIHRCVRAGVRAPLHGR